MVVETTWLQLRSEMKCFLTGWEVNLRLAIASTSAKYDPKIRGLWPLLTTNVPKVKLLEMDSSNPPLPGRVGLVHVT
ncbi:hypothetical protein TNCV_3111281 [Trichonephila clavipes]|nr:hypothetical protein TNCV_3111281 [Trichonephila clavipes]